MESSEVPKPELLLLPPFYVFNDNIVEITGKLIKAVEFYPGEGAHKFSVRRYGIDMVDEKEELYNNLNVLIGLVADPRETKRDKAIVLGAGMAYGAAEIYFRGREMPCSTSALVETYSEITGMPSAPPFQRQWADNCLAYGRKRFDDNQGLKEILLKYAAPLLTLDEIPLIVSEPPGILTAVLHWHTPMNRHWLLKRLAKKKPRN